MAVCNHEIYFENANIETFLLTWIWKRLNKSFVSIRVKILLLMNEVIQQKEKYIYK